MAVLQRALFTWFILLVFLILLVLRLDSRIQWNWFIVFIPVWFYDTILMVYIFFNMMSHCRNSHDRLSNCVVKKLFYLFAIILKLISLIVLCLKLESPSTNISTLYVMFPIWICLPFCVFNTCSTLVANGRSRYL